MKLSATIFIRVLVLAILYFICFAIASTFFIPRSIQESTTTDNNTVLLSVLAMSFLNAAVLSYLILRSRLAGWRLALSIFIVFFGIATAMPQIETAVFIAAVPPGVLTGIVLSGLVLALLLSPLAVLVLGKRKDGENQTTSRLQMSSSQWLLKLSLIAVSYVLIYFTFGYFVAWRDPAVRAYYHGTDPGSFLNQLKIVLRTTPWLPILQFVRGVLWSVLAIPVIRMMKGGWWEAGLAVALSFSVLTTSQLLIPNPLMPTEVRMAHLLETASSNFIFGWLVVLVLMKR